MYNATTSYLHRSTHQKGTAVIVLCHFRNPCCLFQPKMGSVTAVIVLCHSVTHVVQIVVKNIIII